MNKRLLATGLAAIIGALLLAGTALAAQGQITEVNPSGVSVTAPSGQTHETFFPLEVPGLLLTGQRPGKPGAAPGRNTDLGLSD